MVPEMRRIDVWDDKLPSKPGHDSILATLVRTVDDL